MRDERLNPLLAAGVNGDVTSGFTLETHKYFLSKK